MHAKLRAYLDLSRPFTLAAPALYLGTTSGELWIGRDEGARWSNIARHLPEIYAVEVAALA